jgi:hypothetical protein
MRNAAAAADRMAGSGSRRCSAVERQERANRAKAGEQEWCADCRHSGVFNSLQWRRTREKVWPRRRGKKINKLYLYFYITIK